MTIPANLIAGLLASGSSHPISLSITAPLSGSAIANNSTAQAIAGVASSIAGNITSLQYKIDSGSFTNFSFTPAASVNYSGGNAGEIGGGGHTITVQATDAASNTISVTSSYTITGSPPAPSYVWVPSDVYSGANSGLTIGNAAKSAIVAYTQTQYDAHNDVVGTLGMTTLGTTDGNGDFSYTATTAWASNAMACTAQLYVGGTQVGTFQFYNVGSQTYSYTPSAAPNGTQITLSIAGSWANSTVTQTTTYSPSGTVAGPTVLGSTSSTGNFSYSSTTSWGTDTSCAVNVMLNGSSIGTFGFTS